jgi:hypothetical protein
MKTEKIKRGCAIHIFYTRERFALLLFTFTIFIYGNCFKIFSMILEVNKTFDGIVRSIRIHNRFMEF